MRGLEGNQHGDVHRLEGEVFVTKDAFTKTRLISIRTTMEFEIIMREDV